MQEAEKGIGINSTQQDLVPQDLAGQDLNLRYLNLQQTDKLAQSEQFSPKNCHYLTEMTPGRQKEILALINNYEASIEVQQQPNKDLIIRI